MKNKLKLNSKLELWHNSSYAVYSGTWGKYIGFLPCIILRDGLAELNEGVTRADEGLRELKGAWGALSIIEGILRRLSVIASASILFSFTSLAFKLK